MEEPEKMPLWISNPWENPRRTLMFLQDFSGFLGKCPRIPAVIYPGIRQNFHYQFLLLIVCLFQKFPPGCPSTDFSQNNLGIYLGIFSKNIQQMTFKILPVVRADYYLNASYGFWWTEFLETNLFFFLMRNLSFSNVD